MELPYVQALSIFGRRNADAVAPKHRCQRRTNGGPKLAKEAAVCVSSHKGVWPREDPGRYNPMAMHRADPHPLQAPERSKGLTQYAVPSSVSGEMSRNKATKRLA